MDAPFGTLKYLYVGSARFEEDHAFYRDVIGAPLVWTFQRFGARVSAFRVGPGPLLLIADHRPAPSCLPIFEVDDLERTASTLKARGWKPEGPPFEVPDGPCYRLHDPSGNPLAILQIVRPDALVQAYGSRSTDGE